DPNKDDKAYLPIEAKQSEAHTAACNKIKVESWREECLFLDWTDSAVDYKLGLLAEVIRQIDDGRGADIIALQEVENVQILERLRSEFLADIGYGTAILVEGDDLRGIDVGFLSKLQPVGQPILHHIAFADFPDRTGDTRGILQATFQLPDGSLLTGFAVHFPAPYQPVWMRIEAYRHLTRLRTALPPDHHAFAAGDFNTTSTEDARENLLEQFVRPFWTATHDDCQGCPGTYYYARDDNWSFLDMILFSPARGTKATWQIRADSVRIANRIPSQVTPDGKPARFNLRERTGVSDHWPLLVMIEAKQNQ
ncbi:MAG: endonuclease/exonuclease/phosphatase family protein, partial [Proteobacteria bacterium]|nr:endonuclease/exonuclease/phosphatase family protein [Pseudomonadota bacterium]